jgi:FlaA1/EpsC-like NDP-sugar epimerase
MQVSESANLTPIIECEMNTRRKSEFPFEGLLNRPQSAVDYSTLRDDIEGKSLLVTGAGGSIGSEVAAAILSMRPRRLILLELSEHALYRVCLRLSKLASDKTTIVPVLGNVCDARLLDHLLGRYLPDTIFHAAAFKHVPLMEQNRFAAVTNNAVGTYTLAKAAVRQQTRKLVLVSTDKAVNPISVMGATKRVAELVLANLGTPDTKMTSIRLGNVLGSQGSVSPLFLEQIESGGPVTITHPDVCRYFISLKEATFNILRAASFPMPGRILLPDMGEPIKISALARSMIRRLSDQPIEIVITGLRPGDKLSEELMSQEELSRATTYDEFTVVETPAVDPLFLRSCICELEQSAQLYDEEKLMTTLHSLIPEFEIAEHATS